MIFVIVPLGKEAKQVGNWIARVAMYTAGSMVGAGLLALVIGFAGQFLHALLPVIELGLAVAVLGFMALLLALHELNILRLPTPQNSWQVPQSWMRGGRMVGNTLYGLVLGAGVFTFIPFAGFYVLLGIELVAGAADLRASVAIGLVYGLLRGLPAVAGGISVLRGHYPTPVSNWLIARLGWWHALNALALLLVGGFFLGSLVL